MGKIKRGQQYQGKNGTIYTVYSIKNDVINYYLGNRVYKDKTKCVFLETPKQSLDTRYSLERFEEMIEDGEYTLITR